MMVTLHCDASFDARVGVGGWGVWLRSDAGRVVRGGVVPDYCTLAYEAELAAIFAGVWIAVQTWPHTHEILVRTDCDQALRLMSGDLRPKAEHVGAVRLCEKLAALHTVHLIPRWIRGHQNNKSDTGAWLNDRVDDIARTVMTHRRFSMLYRDHDAELASCDALRAASRLGQRMYFMQGTDEHGQHVIEVRLLDDDTTLLPLAVPVFAYAAISEVCDFLAWVDPQWESLARTQRPDRPTKIGNDGLPGSCVVAADTRRTLMSYAYARRNVVNYVRGST